MEWPTKRSPGARRLTPTPCVVGVSVFEEKGVAGVGVIAKGRGRKSWLPEGTVAEVARVTNNLTPPDGSTHWSTWTLGDYLGIWKDFVARIWRDHNLKPWQVKTFKVSNDPDFEEKLVDVVGLYMDPPKRAVVFSFDEKTQVQALDRTEPSLPMRPGRAGTTTSTTTSATGQWTYLRRALGHRRSARSYDQANRKRHTVADVLTFFEEDRPPGAPALTTCT